MNLKAGLFPQSLQAWNYFNSRLSVHWREEMGLRYRCPYQKVRMIPPVLTKSV